MTYVRMAHCNLLKTCSGFSGMVLLRRTGKFLIIALIFYVVLYFMKPQVGPHYSTLTTHIAKIKDKHVIANITENENNYHNPVLNENNYHNPVPNTCLAQEENAIATTKVDRNEGTDSFMEKLKLRMNERKLNLLETCKDMGLDQEGANAMKVLVSKQYKLVYCYIPKVGCSNMKQIMLELGGFNMSKIKVREDIHEFSMKEECRISTESEFFKDKNFTKFMIVRDPYQRLISAYNDKILTNGRFFARLTKIMRAKYRKDRSNRTVTAFDEFIAYISDGHNTKQAKGGEPHWNTYNSLCHPCLVDYDVIAHLETIEEDARYLFNLVGTPSHIKFEVGYSKDGSSQTKKGKFVEEYFKQLTPAEMERLYEAYKVDFNLFGYIANFTNS